MPMGSASAAQTLVILMTLKIRLEKVSNQTESRLLLQMKQHPLLQMMRLLTTLLRFVDAKSQGVVILIHPDQTVAVQIAVMLIAATYHAPAKHPIHTAIHNLGSSFLSTIFNFCASDNKTK